MATADPELTSAPGPKADVLPKADVPPEGVVPPEAEAPPEPPVPPKDNLPPLVQVPPKAPVPPHGPVPPEAEVTSGGKDGVEGESPFGVEPKTRPNFTESWKKSLVASRPRFRFPSKGVRGLTAIGGGVAAIIIVAMLLVALPNIVSGLSFGDSASDHVATAAKAAPVVDPSGRASAALKETAPPPAQGPGVQEGSTGALTGNDWRSPAGVINPAVRSDGTGTEPRAGTSSAPRSAGSPSEPRAGSKADTSTGSNAGTGSDSGSGTDTGSGSGSSTTAGGSKSANTTKAPSASTKPKTGLLGQADFPSGRTITIRSTANGKYVRAEMNYTGKKYGMLRAVSDQVADWEQFRLIWNGSNKAWMLQSAHNGRYVASEVLDGGWDEGQLRARADSAGGWEMFKLYRLDDGSYALRNIATGGFVSAELNHGGDAVGMLRARADSVGGWERFSLS